MKISVALACYNGGEYILQQLESLKNQSTLPDEVIICDDASADNTAEIVRKFIENNSLKGWRLFVNDVNLGYIKNFRKAMSLCGGELVFLCDQDDIWDSEKIRIMTEVFKKQSNVLSLACNYAIINQFGEASKEKLQPMYKASRFMRAGTMKKITGALLQGNIAQGCACAYKKALVEEYLKKDTECKLPHDWALNLLAFEGGGLYYLNLPLLSYRVHADNATGAITAGESVSSRAEILEKLAENTEYAAKLVPEKANDYLSLASFIRYRAEVVRSGSLSMFIKGFFKYPGFALERNLLQYCKDYFASNKTR